MDSNQVTSLVENAILKVVADFQKNADYFRCERDLHWSLFHYLEQGKMVEESYPTELIRAEFPTLKVFSGNRQARGHYDIAILNHDSYYSPKLRAMGAHAPWKEYLKFIQIDVAIEVKLWLARVKFEKYIDWDVGKLTGQPHRVRNGYFLNFTQLDFKSEYSKKYYRELRQYLITKKQPDLKILCVPMDSQIQPDSKDNWI